MISNYKSFSFPKSRLNEQTNSMLSLEDVHSIANNNFDQINMDIINQINKLVEITLQSQTHNFQLRLAICTLSAAIEHNHEIIFHINSFEDIISMILTNIHLFDCETMKATLFLLAHYSNNYPFKNQILIENDGQLFQILTEYLVKNKHADLIIEILEIYFYMSRNIDKKFIVHVYKAMKIADIIDHSKFWMLSNPFKTNQLTKAMLYLVNICINISSEPTILQEIYEKFIDISVHENLCDNVCEILIDWFCISYEENFDLLWSNQSKQFFFDYYYLQKNLNCNVNLITKLLKLLAKIGNNVDEIDERNSHIFFDFIYKNLIEVNTSDRNSPIIANALKALSNLSSITGCFTDLMVSTDGFLDELVYFMNDASFKEKASFCAMLSNLLFESSQYFENILGRFDICEIVIDLLWSGYPQLQQIICIIFSNIILNCTNERYLENFCQRIYNDVFQSFCSLEGEESSECFQCYQQLFNLLNPILSNGSDEL